MSDPQYPPNSCYDLFSEYAVIFKPHQTKIEPDESSEQFIKYITIQKMGPCMGNPSRQRHYILQSPQKQPQNTQLHEPTAKLQSKQQAADDSKLVDEQKEDLKCTVMLKRNGKQLQAISFKNRTVSMKSSQQSQRTNVDGVQRRIASLLERDQIMRGIYEQVQQRFNS